MDRARKVRKILPVSPCDIRGLEAWLEEQANAGLFPVSIGSWAVFTTDGVPGTRFRLEPYDRGRTAPTEEQQELYRGAGWSYALTQDVMSRHRGAKPTRRCGLLGEISLLSPG